MNETIERLLSTIEKARRAEEYGRMDAATNALVGELMGDDSLDAWATRSKMTYELHMAAYQQAMASLQKSMDLANQSAEEARKAGDAVDALYAQMNISGLLLPALGRRKEGFELSQQVYQESQALSVVATDDKARDRADRVGTNALFHQIRMLMEDDGDSAEMKRLFGLATSTSFYRTHEPEYRDGAKGVEEYLNNKT